MRLLKPLHVAVAAGFLVSATGTAMAQKKYDTGATDTEIKIGNIIPYSGLPPPMASSARRWKATSRR
jgi:hypothetical protein